MIFRRALLREIANGAAAVFLVLFLIALTMRLVRLLGQAAGGKIPSEAVLAHLGFFALHVLPVLLSLALFIAVLLALTRSFRDSEMVIWFCAGLAPSAWVKPVFAFAAPLVAVIAVLAFFLSPWAAAKSEQYRARLEARDEISRVSPGVFGETRAHSRVYFVEAGATEGVVQNVFVSSTQHGRGGIMMAARAWTESAPNGDRFLMLRQGRRYEGTAGAADFRIMEFERYAMRIEPREGAEPAATAKALSTLALVADPKPQNLGELVWRIGIPVSALLLALLAIPLAFFNPRAGRSINFVFALLVYMTYANLISVSQARVAQGKLDFALGASVVHGAMLLLLLALLWYRQSPFALRRWRG